MHAGKPIIGVVGGIGSGKSFIARMFADEGCLVINSDEQVSDAYRDEDVKRILRDWWGDEMVGVDGLINRRAIAARVFNDPAQLKRLEGLIHPRVNAARERAMSAAGNDPTIKAFIWDTPLLFETGLNAQCDAIVFVDAPLETRLARVTDARGWNAAELTRRENSQWPLDKKRQISDYVVQNTADAGYARGQVRDVLSRILAQLT